MKLSYDYLCWQAGSPVLSATFDYFPFFLLKSTDLQILELVTAGTKSIQSIFLSFSMLLI